LIRSSGPITEGPLSQAQVRRTLSLVGAATEADGVGPLSEHVLLHLQHGTGERSRDLIVTEGLEVAGYAHLDLPDPDAADDGMSGELVVHPARRRRGHGTALVAALEAGARGHAIRLWAHGDLPAAAGLAQSAGFTRVRSLWQMRRSLVDSIASPVFPPGTTLRTFVPRRDEEEWLTLNRRAFADHPEQGSWTSEDLLVREHEPWFDPAGFLISERDSRMAGFHWTKIHPAAAGTRGRIGEVYVLGVDPDEQGSGLGRALTLAGLRHLQARGLTQVMLYVDETNAPAIRMYQSLGFLRWSTDVMYQRA
jgi:mycothiol synthase